MTTISTLKKKLLGILSCYEELNIKSNRTLQEEYLHQVCFKSLEVLQTLVDLYDQSSSSINRDMSNSLVRDFLNFKPANSISNQPDSTDWMAFGTAAAMTGLFNHVVEGPISPEVESQQINDFHSMMEEVEFDK